MINLKSIEKYTGITGPFPVPPPNIEFFEKQVITSLSVVNARHAVTESVWEANRPLWRKLAGQDG